MSRRTTEAMAIRKNKQSEQPDRNIKSSASSNKKSNRRILGMIYVFAFLFFGMIGYMVYFIGFQAEGLMGNPYNARMDVFNDRYVRGSILSADGQILARTDVDADGKETRVYPYGTLFAHAIGYSTKGKTGLESAANFYLMKSNQNPLFQVYNELTETKSQGDNVVSTLNLGLQQVAAKALGDRNGAVIAMEPSTGRILAMVSNPTYDPNTVVEDWSALTAESNTGGNLVNRATQGLYPPGSTFKIVMALEYMREHPGDWQNFQFDCDGEYVDPENKKYVVHCFDGEVHGAETLETAFANSCNSAFAKIGTEINKTKLRELAEALMFNQDLPIAISSSKSRFNVDSSSDTWTMMQSAIGQGTTMMSPLHNLLITAAIANGGVLKEPVMLDRVESVDGKTIQTFGDGAEQKLMSAEEASTIGGFMRKVVTVGTASKLRTDAYAAAGKTGSAEYTEGGKTKTDAWFTGFAPYDHPEIAVCVVVEDGETGGRTAAPIARAVFDYWITERS